MTKFISTLVLLPGGLYKITPFLDNLIYKIIVVHMDVQGSGGVTIKKTGQAIVFGIYEEPVTPGQCNMVVERLGDYLAEQGL